MIRHHSVSRSVTRRTFLGASAMLGAAIAVSGVPRPRVVPASDTTESVDDAFRASLSVSPFTESTLGAVSLTDGASTATTVDAVQRLLNRHGATEIFARVATLKNAPSGDAEYGLSRAVERATLARSLGMPFNPELGLWAVYGDIRDQPAPDFRDYPAIQLPGPWASLTLPQMQHAFRQYGTLVARQILATGVRVNFWDLGNEVEYGVAGVAVRSFGTTSYSPPDGVDPAIGQMTAQQLLSMSEADRIGWLQRHMWPYVGRLLAAVADGIREVDHGARFSTHISGIAVESPVTPIAFWEAMKQAGYRPNQFGTSFYPTAPDIGDRRAILLDTAEALHGRFGRKLFLAEYSYPSGIMNFPYAWNTTQVGYPQTVDGQARYLRDLIDLAAGTRSVAGIRPWAPDYCTASGGWAPMSLFETDGSAKPALDALRASAMRRR